MQMQLGDDELALVLGALCNGALCKIPAVCRRWHQACREEASRRLSGGLAPSPRLALNGAGPSHLFVLGAVTALESAVGPRPSDLDWRAEFSLAERNRFACKFAWSLELREMKWPQEEADVVSIVYTWGNRSLSAAARDGSRTFAASTWAVGEALLRAALRSPRCNSRLAAHPPLYAKLRGRGGLAHGDETWECLLGGGGGGGGDAPAAPAAPAALPGQTFATRGIALATAEHARTSAVVWAGQPTASPFEGGVVRFLPARPDTAGIHALVDVGSGRYALPPLSLVTLVRVDEPGEWRLEEDAGECSSSSSSTSGDSSGSSGSGSSSSPDRPKTRCRLYTVRVAWV